MIVLVLLVAVALFSGIFLLVHHLRTQQNEVLLPTFFDQSQALMLLWNLYGVIGSPMPAIDWIRGERLNCARGTGWNSKMGCVAGLSWQDLNRCDVAWPAGTKKISETGFAHEVWHAATWHNGQPDPNHTGPGFAPGGMVEQGNAALRAAGL